MEKSKVFIVFCSGEEYHDANDVVVRVFKSDLNDEDDPRYPENLEYEDFKLTDLLKEQR